MTALHHLQVRRSRGLPMPLPPKPAKRPLGPKALCHWRGVPIRMRSDVEKAGTWDELLDEMASEQGHALSLDTFPSAMIGRGVDAVRMLTPEHERASAMRDFWARVRVVMDRGMGSDRWEHERRRVLAQEERDLGTPIAWAIALSKANLPKPSLIARFFGRHA